MTKNNFNIVWAILSLFVIIILAFGRKFRSSAAEILPEPNPSCIDFWLFSNGDNYAVLAFNKDVTITSSHIESSGGNYVLGGSGNGASLIQILVIGDDGTFSDWVTISSTGFWSNVKWATSSSPVDTTYNCVSSDGISWSNVIVWYDATFEEEPPAPDDFNYFTVWLKGDYIYLLSSVNPVVDYATNGRFTIEEYNIDKILTNTYNYDDGLIDMSSLGYTFLFDGTETECNNYIANYNFPSPDSPSVSIDVSDIVTRLDRIFFLVLLIIAWIIGTGLSKKIM